MLKKEIRILANDYLLNHVVPKTVTPRPSNPMDWFLDLFNFVNDIKLGKQLAEAFFHARFMGRVIEAFGLKGDFSNGFVKAQIILYASIYEAIIDFALETHENLEPVVKLCTDRTLKEAHHALSKNTSLIFKTGEHDEVLVPCRVVYRKRKLKEIQFKQRLDTAIEIGLVDRDSSDFINNLYISRNSVHLTASAQKEFKPNKDESSEAFKRLFDFVENAKKWFAANKASSRSEVGNVKV